MDEKSPWPPCRSEAEHRRIAAFVSGFVHGVAAEEEGRAEAERLVRETRIVKAVSEGLRR